MALYVVPFWKKNPFVRLLIPVMAGILLQWYLQITPGIWWVIAACCSAIILSFFFIPLFKRYRLGFLNGIAVTVIFLATGGLLAWHKDIRHEADWLGHHYNRESALLVTLDEPLSEKTKSFKANASVVFIINRNNYIPAKGKIILYFKKDGALQLDYGSEIIFKKPLQAVKNSGNPGGFDYKRYLLFKNITHQVYLKPGEFVCTGNKNQKWLAAFLYRCRNNILHILRNSIKGHEELGLAEALLIGYKDDLDPSLVQSYTNTGVVHIIAISGLHLGLIYWLLVHLFKPLQKRKTFKWLRPLFIISGLWLFSLLAGGQPSVMRSALMFTCIILGENLTRKTSIHNTLAFSAFLLLCYNPYWLWDLGFQLSYSAVLSIIVFMRPVYNWFYIQNKLLDLIWKLNAVTIAAQILTTPLSIYHFHQFPNYFLLTNLLAVPLSSIILLGEIWLCIAYLIPAFADFSGKIISWLIRLMNNYIENIEALPFSLWEGLQISIGQAILLFAFIACAAYWLMERAIIGLRLCLLAFLGFLILRSRSFQNAIQQQKIIIYNVARHKAIDFITGRKHFFLGDAEVNTDDFTRNFHLRPSRVLNRSTAAESLPGLFVFKNHISFNGRNILLIDTRVTFLQKEKKPVVELLVISGNPRLSIASLANSLYIKQLVFDASVPAWKLEHWKKSCDSLGIAYHDVVDKGAFVMSLR